MIRELNLQLTPEQAYTPQNIIKAAAQSINISESSIADYQIIRKSIDARGRKIVMNVAVNISTGEKLKKDIVDFDFKNVANCQPIVVVGAGPAGLFAAMRLIEKGFKPIILERGKDVSARKIDVAKMYREHLFNDESNYCFGEGGAGTFSDGKLFTRSKKRGDNRRVLHNLVYHGAQDNILYEAHPHIGSDKLSTVISQMRKTIIACGGEVLFNTKLIDFELDGNKIKSVQTSTGEKFEAKAVILATGHSARDIYRLLHNKGIALEAKAFAVGVRIEHPQALINDIQYHRSRDPYLPTAAYNLVTQVDGRGVYSFCMCPGGIIVPATSAANEQVVNGMSNSMRNSPYANSGMAVEVRVEDLTEYSQYGVLAGLEYQQNLERMARLNAGTGLQAPAQAVADFVRGKVSAHLPQTSYLPGVVSSPLHFWLPENINHRLREGFAQFDKKMHGFVTNEALILGVESRTSSPVRIPRNPETLQHIQIENLFPCGEGAGYAGGIVSSAVDGELCAESVAHLF